MTSNVNKKIWFLVFGFLLLAPILASAASFPYWGPLASCTGTNCRSLCDLLVTAQNVIYFLMTLAVLALAPIMIVIGGIMMLVSAGSEGGISKGRKMVTGAVIGIAIALGAFIIINTFLWAIANTAELAKSGLTIGTSGWTIQCTAPSPVPNSFQGVGASPY